MADTTPWLQRYTRPENGCAHCGQAVKPDGKRCRHGILCGPCEWELEQWYPRPAVTCACGHPYEEHNQFWDDEVHMGGMGCDHCDCENPQQSDGSEGIDG